MSPLILACLLACSDGDGQDLLADGGAGGVGEAGTDAMPGQADGAVKDVPDAGIDETCTSEWCALSVAPSSSKRVSVTPAGQPWVVVGRGADERRNGDWFHHEPSWDHPTDPFLSLGEMFEIRAFSQNNVWVGGELGYIGHWNGSVWTEHRPIAPTAKGIWGSPDDFWVLYDTGARYRWNGEDLVAAESSDIRYTGAWGLSSDDVWGYGRGPEVPYVPAVDHWNGLEWESELLPGNGRVVSFWASGPEDLWAVISDGRLLHGDATSWTDSGLAANLKAVWGTSASDIWAVGKSGTILHYDGSVWSSSPSGTAKTLLDIDGSGDAVWVIGDGVALRKL